MTTLCNDLEAKLLRYGRDNDSRPWRAAKGRCEAFMKFDPEDAPFIAAHKWWFHNGYARGWVLRDGVKRKEYLHRIIAAATPSTQVDHINGDTLDNRRSNLRLVDRAQNQQNRRGSRVDNPTGRRGVERTPHGKFTARVTVNRRRIWLGSYQTIEEADAAAREGRRRFMTHSKECAS